MHSPSATSPTGGAEARRVFTQPALHDDLMGRRHDTHVTDAGFANPASHHAASRKRPKEVPSLPPCDAKAA